MSLSDTTVTVTISGSEFTLCADDDPEYIRKLAAYVDRKIAELERTTHQQPRNRLAILAALNIADEVAHPRKDAESTSARILPVEKKHSKRTFGSARGLISMRADFDEPLDEFAEYRP